ncbi:hypothetical protein GCM10010270_57030 [Streptomyces violaceus]|nr:hypothetical protein GCM10010270_57030 [Streptomyces janthinus]
MTPRGWGGPADGPGNVRDEGEWALTTGRYAAAKEGPVATAEQAGRGSVDDLLTV